MFPFRTDLHLPQQVRVDSGREPVGQWGARAARFADAAGHSPAGAKLPPRAQILDAHFAERVLRAPAVHQSHAYARLHDLQSVLVSDRRARRWPRLLLVRLETHHSFRKHDFDHAGLPLAAIHAKSTQMDILLYFLAVRKISIICIY
jgi:hypothetical protein